VGRTDGRECECGVGFTGAMGFVGDVVCVLDSVCTRVGVNTVVVCTGVRHPTPVYVLLVVFDV
jgi:hypothetical protein